MRSERRCARPRRYRSWGQASSRGGAPPPPLVKHFNRPEGNVTGVSLGGDLSPKRMQILAEMVPGAVISVLMNPTLTQHKLSREAMEQDGRALSVKLVIATGSTDADLDP